MANGPWFELSDQPGDRPALDRFATIMQAMDPRYRSLTGDQLASWMKAQTSPFKGSVVQAFGWFVDGAGKDKPGKMQIALACRYEKAVNRALWMMLGWAAPNFGRGTLGTSSLTENEITTVLTLVADKLVEWLQSLQPANPTGGLVIAVRPHVMQAGFMQKLYDQAYFNAIADRPIGTHAISINRERNSPDTTYLELKFA